MDFSKGRSIFITIILCCLNPVSNTVFAQENKNEEPLTLEATIKKQEITLQEIRDVRLDLRRVMGAATDIFDEVTREPINFSTAPNVVGSSIIINPIHIKEASVLEPRDKWIVNSVSKMGPTIELLRADVENIGQDSHSFAFSEKSQKTFVHLTKDWKSIVKEMYSQYKLLKSALAERPYNNESIAARARSIYLEAKALEKTRRQAEKLFKSEMKKRKREEKSRSKRD